VILGMRCGRRSGRGMWRGSRQNTNAEVGGSTQKHRGLPISFIASAAVVFVGLMGWDPAADSLGGVETKRHAARHGEIKCQYRMRGKRSRLRCRRRGWIALF
jgi:hypothetical protein